MCFADCRPVESAVDVPAVARQLSVHGAVVLPCGPFGVRGFEVDMVFSRYHSHGGFAHPLFKLLLVSGVPEKP